MTTDTAAPTTTPSARTGKRRSLAMRPRGALLKTHRWVSLVLAVWVVIQGLTGAILVFDDQINAWSRPELFKHTKGAGAGPAAVAAATRKAVPKGRLVSVQFPTMNKGVYVGVSSMAPPTQPFGDQRLVYVNPGTGKVNGIRNTDEGFTHWVARVHDSLLQDEFLGMRGRTITALLGALTILVLLTGLYVWYWPGVRRLYNTFRRHKKAKPLAKQRNLHRAVGVLVVPFLLVIMITGINLQFPEKGRSIWYSITPGADAGTRQPAKPVQSVRQPGVKPLTLDQASAKAKALTHGRVMAVSPAFGPTSAVGVRVSNGWDPTAGPRGRGGNVTIYIDQYSGRQVKSIGPTDFPVAGQAYEFWTFPLHIGSWGGTPSRLLWLASGLGLVTMGYTGVAMFLLRRRGRARRRELLHEAMPLPEVYVDQAETKADVRPVAAGAAVVREGDEADFFYVVLDGHFDVLQGEPAVKINEVGPGQSFGEIGLLVTGVRTATVQATTDGEVLALPIEDLRSIVDRADRDGVRLDEAGAAFARELMGR
jgi:uncharacterized iron-regulated membrane protein